MSGLFDVRSYSVKNQLSMMLTKCSMEENWHEVTAGALNLQAQSDTGGCRAINNSPVANQWSKESTLGSFVVLVSHVKHITVGKFGYNVDLHTNEERSSYTLLANLKMPSNMSCSEKDKPSTASS